MSNSLWPHGLRHARLPCPPLTPRACSNSCPLSWWCHPTNLILCCLLLFLPNRIFCSISLFQRVSSSHQVTEVLEFQLQRQSFQWIFRTDFIEHWLAWFPRSPRDSQESSNTTVQNHQFFGIHLPLQSNSHIHTLTTRKTIALTRWTFVDKVMSLLCNMLSRLVTAFLPRSKHLLISWL